jgi:hypothetical protein
LHLQKKNMAHFVELDANNVVLRGIVVNNAETVDENGVEKESIGVAFCERLLGGVWKQTSYNGNIRKQYAGVGYTYDAVRDAFITPRPYLSWALDENSDWQAPLPRPDDGKVYGWDEEALAWVEIKGII